jgi:hypothetical protein
VEYEAARSANARFKTFDLVLSLAYSTAALDALITDRLREPSDNVWALAERLARELDDVVLLVHFHYNRSDGAMANGDYRRAAQLAQAALELWPYWDAFPRTLVILDHRLAVAALLNGDPPAAARHLEPVLLLFDRVAAADHDFEFWVVLIVCCGLLLRRGDPDAAEALWRYIEPDVEVPSFDIHGIGPLKAEIEEALAKRPAGDRPPALQDREQAMDLALNRLAELRASR